MSKRIAVIILLILSILPLLDLFHPGLPVTHDGQDHVARIANFFESLTEGNIVPRWAANLNWGYGHPILMFLYPMPSYIASAFHFIALTFVDSTKLVFAVSFMASILTMFLWISEAWGVPAGIVAALLYGFAPYRFVDLYVRGAIGEHVAFVFAPIVMYALLLLSKSKKLIRGGNILALGMAGLILSHNAVSLMFLPVILLYVSYLLFFETKDKKNFLLHVIFYMVLGFMLSAFFWMPAFFEGKYTLRDIVTKGNFGDRFVPFQWFFYSPWNYGGGNEFSKSLGVVQWFVIASGVFVFFKTTKAKIRLFIGVCFVLLAASLFLMTSWSALVWEKISLLQKFQFPWRLLTLCVFIVSVLGGFVAEKIPRKRWVISFVAITIVLLLSTIDMWHARDYSIKPQEFYSGIYNGTTDTGESSPIWSVRFMEKRPTAPAEVIEGDAVITDEERTGMKHRYTIEAKVKTRIAENTLYFPGWRITSDGSPVSIEFQDPQYRGLMTFWLDAGPHKVIVEFVNTKLRTFSEIFSIIGLTMLFGIPLFSTLWKRFLSR